MVLFNIVSPSLLSLVGCSFRCGENGQRATPDCETHAEVSHWLHYSVFQCLMTSVCWQTFRREVGRVLQWLAVLPVHSHSPSHASISQPHRHDRRWSQVPRQSSPSAQDLRWLRTRKYHRFVSVTHSPAVTVAVWHALQLWQWQCDTLSSCDTGGVTVWHCQCDTLSYSWASQIIFFTGRKLF